MISIFFSVILTSIISLFFGCGRSNIIGFWNAFSIAFGSQVIIALVYKSFRIDADKKDNAAVEEQFNEILSLCSASFECPCTRYTFTEELFMNADNVFKCPTCGSNVKVNINVSPILQTDVLADNIQTSLESVTTEAEATA